MHHIENPAGLQMGAGRSTEAGKEWKLGIKDQVNDFKED
jgi:hypothetical protein